MKYIRSRPIEFTDPDAGRSSSGHKFHNWLTGLYLAKLYNLEYIYSPFTQDAERYENFLNLSKGYKKITDINPIGIFNVPSFQFCHDDSLSEEVFKENLNRFAQYVEMLPEGGLIDLAHNPFPGMLTQHYELVIPELQKLFWGFDRNTNLYERGDINVAVHIRRGDINLNSNPDRWLDLMHYANIIQNLNRELGRDNIKIYVFSEGQYDDFTDLADENVYLILGGSDLEAVQHMCAADILVTGQSSFSIMAAYFNRNFTIYTPLKNFMYKWGNDRIMHYKKVNYDLLREKLLK